MIAGPAMMQDCSLSLTVAPALAAYFAIAHGHAHGSEIPNTISGFAYGAGYQPVDEADHVAMHATCAGGLWASI